MIYLHIEGEKMEFVWDRSKAQTNHQKHGISFEEAQTVFHDAYARLIHDPDHSDDEDRFILLGISCTPRLLVVCHCYKKNEIRIISARKATKKETISYENFRHA
jgi:uncharacterized protein